MVSKERVTPRKDRVLIFPVDDSPPPEGFYSIRLRKHCPLRALGIICNAGLWLAYIDGEPFVHPSLDWKEAFGALHHLTMLTGERLGMEAYKDLVRRRTIDRLNGVDLDKPTHPNQQRIEL